MRKIDFILLFVIVAVLTISLDETRFPEFLYSKMGMATYVLTGLMVLAVHAYFCYMAFLKWRQIRSLICFSVTYVLLVRFVYIVCIEVVGM